MTESVATQFLRSADSEENSSEKIKPTYTPKTTFTLDQCWFINDVNTKQIHLFNKNIAEACKVAVFLNGEELSDITHNKAEIFAKWDTLLVTVFGIKYYIKRILPQTTENGETNSIESRISTEQKFLISNESDSKFNYEVRRLSLIDSNEKLPEDFKILKGKKGPLGYLKLNTYEATLCSLFSKKKDALESLACKTAFMYIICHALRLKLNRLLEETTDCSFKEKTDLLTRIKNYWKENRTFSIKDILNKLSWNENRMLIQDILEFKVKFLTQMPINLNRALTVIPVWKEIESVFFLKDHITELENKLDTLNEINKANFEAYLKKYGTIVAFFLFIFTAISGINDFIELINK
ncbi:hypothetical protein [uncultured Succinivibrio sp.]|uniref:hypothetical protein n=1 Tax=uncultured Succinivibrio sp. TaxID=540749 RepID=UPI0025EC7887|nr:hypothetical protein [uncultured Succinivibrio sp.]